MASIQDIGSLSALDLASSSFLADFQSATVSVDDDTVRNDALTRGGQSVQTTKRGVTFDVDLLSTLSGSDPERVSHLHLSALTVGGTNYLTDLEGGTIEISYEQKKKPGAGSLWHYPQNVTKHIRATLKIGVPATGGVPLMVNQFSATLTTQNAALSFTLNSVTTTITMRVVKVSQPFERDGLQIFEVTLEGRDPGTGAWPSAPTGTTTLLEKAFNDFKTAIAFNFTSHATEGYNLAGNMVFASVNINIQDGDLVATKYQFKSQGTITATAT